MACRGIETIPEAYKPEQDWMTIFSLVVHLFVVGCAFYVRNSRLLHTRRILALSTTSAITIAICVHVCVREVFVATAIRAQQNIWIITTALVFLAPALAMQACVPVWVQPLIGFIFLQPMLVYLLISTKQ